MLGPTLFTTLLTAATALALPQARSACGGPSKTLNVTYYQGEGTISGSQSTCGFEAVVSGNLTTGVCRQEYTYSLSLTALPKVGCSYTQWKGTTTCDDTTATSKDVTLLSPGGGQYCVTTDVLDGGAHTFASGLLTCA